MEALNPSNFYLAIDLFKTTVLLSLDHADSYKIISGKLTLNSLLDRVTVARTGANPNKVSMERLSLYKLMWKGFFLVQHYMARFFVLLVLVMLLIGCLQKIAKTTQQKLDNAAVPNGVYKDDLVIQGH